MWSVLNFGKYKGKSLPQVILHDPDYFFWGEQNHVFNRGPLAEEATLLKVRARNIRIPWPKPDEWRIRYQLHEGKFADFQIIHSKKSIESDPRDSWRSDRLDLSVPARFKSYDKLGCRLLLKRFKEHFFEGKVRLTKRVCEEFFDNPDNFVMGAVRTLDSDELLFVDEPIVWNMEGCSVVPSAKPEGLQTAAAKKIRSNAEPVIVAAKSDDIERNSQASREEDSTLEWLFAELEP
jgi:hypothetical protein